MVGHKYWEEASAAWWTHIGGPEAQRAVLFACKGAFAKEHPIGQECADKLQTVGLVMPVPQQILKHTPVDVFVASRLTDLDEVPVD